MNIREEAYQVNSEVLETRNMAGNNAIEKVENSIAEDRPRSYSVSPRSSKSASSDFSFEDHPHIYNEHAATPGFTSRLETPPVQVMERPPNNGSSVYRIPSHVFARNKSNSRNPDWSAASNDSLFSINTGNMSYTTDQFTGLLKSCDLGTYGPGDIRKSGEVPYPVPRGVLKSGEKTTLIPSDHRRKSGEGLVTVNQVKAPSSTLPAVTTPSDDVEVMNQPEVIKSVVCQELRVNVNKDDAQPDVEVTKNGRSSLPDDDVTRTSLEQSFAFPVFPEIDKEKSVNSGQKQVEQQKDPLSSDREGAKTQTPAPEGVIRAIMLLTGFEPSPGHEYHHFTTPHDFTGREPVLTDALKTIIEKTNYDY